MSKFSKQKPYLFTIKKHGAPNIGYLMFLENSPNFPFTIKRVFWTYATPRGITRGKHAHRKTQQVLIAAAGTITVTTILPSGESSTFILDEPYKALYIPTFTWATMKYAKNSVQLVMASTLYSENDYIREYSSFSKHLNGLL